MIDPDPRATSKALLESGHQFPGPFEFRVVVRPEAVVSVVTAIAAVVGRPGDVDQRKSSGGKWISVRYRVDVQSADEVLDVYGVLREVKEVVMSI